MNPPVFEARAAVLYCGRRDIRFGHSATASLGYSGDSERKPLWLMGW